MEKKSSRVKIGERRQVEKETQRRMRGSEGKAKKIIETENKTKWENEFKHISHHYKCKWFKFNIF